MLKIGLTGGIGSGKSTVARVFKVLGAQVYRADIEAKRLMNTDENLKNKIIKLFGEEAYHDGKLNSPFIASLVFNDSEKLNRLNAIVHPAVHYDFNHWADYLSSQVYIIEEAAILFETGFYKDFDYMVMVYAEDELRIKRVMERDKVERNKIIERMSNQMDQDRKKELSDFVIFNNENDLIIPQVLSLHHKFISLQN